VTDRVGLPIQPLTGIYRTNLIMYRMFSCALLTVIFLISDGHAQNKNQRAKQADAKDRNQPKSSGKNK